MTPLRSTAEVKIEHAGSAVGRILAGLLIAASFAFPEYIELVQETSHARHVIFFACGVLLGLLVAFGPFVWPALDQAIPRAQQIKVVIWGSSHNDGLGTTTHTQTTVTTVTPEPPPAPPAGPSSSSPSPESPHGPSRP